MPAKPSARLPCPPGRDFQRSRVYAWEAREIAPAPSSNVAFDQAQEMGLRHPPAVERLPRQAHRRMADACRLSIRLPDQTPGWCLLHELAHAMTTTHDGHSDRHGPRFIGVYVGLLERYLRLPRARLLASLAASGVAVDVTARPVFLDAGPAAPGRPP
jgi:hypothetical protein